MNEQQCRFRIKRGDVEIEVEGDKEFVEKHFEEFKKEISKITKELLPFKEITPEIPGKKVGLEKISLAEFYNEKQPGTELEVAITIGYYLMHYEDIKEFTTKVINTEAKKIGHTISNVTRALKEASTGKKAYVHKIKKGVWALTSKGEKFVSEDLPTKSKE